MQNYTTNNTEIFLGQIWGRLSAPVFFQIKTEIPKFLTNFPMSDFVLHFGENFIKITPKLTK